MTYRPNRDPQKEIIIEDIKRTEIGPDDVLFIQLHKHTDPNLLANLQDQLNTFFGEKASKVLIFCGDVKLHKVTIKDGKAVISNDDK